MLQRYPFQIGNAQSRNTWLAMFSEWRWHEVGVCHHVILKTASEHKSPNSSLDSPECLRSDLPIPSILAHFRLAAATADFKQRLLKCAASSSAKPSHQQPFLLSGPVPGPAT